MSWAFFGTLVKKAGKGQHRIPHVFTASPDLTDEEMLAQALWLKQNGYRADRLRVFASGPMATAHGGENPSCKATRESERVYIPKGLRRRRLQKRRSLHKAFLCFHDPDNWPVLRAALRRMGRAELIGSGRHHLVPDCQPDQAGFIPEEVRQAV